MRRLDEHYFFTLGGGGGGGGGFTMPGGGLAPNPSLRPFLLVGCVVPGLGGLGFLDSDIFPLLLQFHEFH